MLSLNKPSRFPRSPQFLPHKYMHAARFFFHVFLLLTAIGLAQAQETNMSYPEILDQTDAAFQKANWQEVIRICEKALSEGSDSFAIRQYLGIAYYRKMQFTLALPHFRKAMTYFGSEPITQEYLYFTLLALGRGLEAHDVATEMEPEDQKRLGLKPNQVLTFVYAEAGTKQSNSETIKPMTLATFGVGHRVRNRTQLYHVGTLIAQENNGLQYKQYQYYVQGRRLIAHNHTAEVALHLVKMDGQASTYDVMQSGVSMFAGWKWTPKRLEVSPQFSWTSLGTHLKSNGITLKDSSSTTTQLGLGLGYWPKTSAGRIWVGLHSDLAWHNNQSFFLTKAWLWAQILPKLNVTASFYTGKAPLTVEDKASLFNNTPDPTANKWSLLAEIPLSKKVSLYGLYQSEQKNTVLLPYKYQAIITGIKIKP